MVFSSFQKKCDHYWPQDEVQVYHGISVEILNTSDLPDFTTRTFKLSKVNILHKMLEWKWEQLLKPDLHLIIYRPSFIYQNIINLMFSSVKKTWRFWFWSFVIFFFVNLYYYWIYTLPKIFKRSLHIFP